MVGQLGQTACFHLFNKVLKQPLRGLKQLVKNVDELNQVLRESAVSVFEKYSN